MKLLLDENLSDRIISQIIDLYPDSTHVKPLALIIQILRENLEIINQFGNSETSILVLM